MSAWQFQTPPVVGAVNCYWWRVTPQAWTARQSTWAGGGADRITGGTQAEGLIGSLAGAKRRGSVETPPVPPCLWRAGTAPIVVAAVWVKELLRAIGQLWHAMNSWLAIT